MTAPRGTLVCLSTAACLALAGVAAPAAAQEWRDWCESIGEDTPLGWHFYCDRAEEDTGDEWASIAPAAPPATARIAAIRRELEESRAAAILDPTPARVAAYLRLQRETLQRAAAFSDAFRRTVWATPDLDYSLTRPVGALAKQLWSDARREEIQAALAGLGESYGLIYLGRSDCAECEVFGPLLRAFSLRHGLDVLAVSMTGEPLEGWPEAVADNGRAAALGLDGAPLPAVALFDAAAREVVPVGFGVLAEDQLAERIFVLTQREPGHDY
ncbi:MAG: conjugal transfer protein TraF [Rhodospirillales bacterium]|nr:conjugal transfer protein TraF [Rhodospirillales bacterium]MDE0228197.1 conjugal transfer protein TraF [Spirochaetaceae bacterium]MDE0455158.1 conjugal transfer protein TraF [Gammaproteobacteria bacterium]